MVFRERNLDSRQENESLVEFRSWTVTVGSEPGVKGKALVLLVRAAMTSQNNFDAILA